MWLSALSYWSAELGQSICTGGTRSCSVTDYYETLTLSLWTKELQIWSDIGSLSSCPPITAWNRLSYITWNWGETCPSRKFLISPTELACALDLPKHCPWWVWGSYFGNFVPSWSLGSNACTGHLHTFLFLSITLSNLDPVNVYRGTTDDNLLDKWLRKHAAWSREKVHDRMSKCFGQRMAWCSIMVRAEVATVWIARSTTTFSPWVPTTE